MGLPGRVAIQSASPSQTNHRATRQGTPSLSADATQMSISRSSRSRTSCLRRSGLRAPSVIVIPGTLVVGRLPHLGRRA